MKEIKKPENTIFYSNYKEAIYTGTPEQVKELMVAFCQYAFDDVKEPQVTGQVKMVWGVIKGNIDRDREQYIFRCEQNRENALKRHSETYTYNVDGRVYELVYHRDSRANIPDENQFDNLFAEVEDSKERHTYLCEFIALGNRDKWSKTYSVYEQRVWDMITQKDNLPF